jgi:hypothetical protein
VPGRPQRDPEATQPWRWWGPFVVAGAALVVFGLLVAGATWYGLSHRSPQVSHSTRPPAAGRTSTPRAAAPTTSITGSCALTLLGGACPTKATCFGRLSVSKGVATATGLSCTATHTWEVFALGTLPASVTTVDYQTVRGTDAVRGLCSSATLGIINMGTVSWQIDVLPPAPSAFANGDRTFRCLAGNGPNSLHQPVFVK